MGFWDFLKIGNGRVKKIEANLKYSFLNIKKDMHSINKVLEHFKSKHEKHDKRFEMLERKLEELQETVQNTSIIDDERSSVHERSSAFKRSIAPFMNVQAFKNTITPAQKRVIHVLSYAEVPLEYADLAKELGISVITVRRHVSDIKRLGFDVKEKINIENGRKVFFLEKAVKKAVRAKK